MWLLKTLAMLLRDAPAAAESREAHDAALAEKLAALIAAEWRRRHQTPADDEKSQGESQPRSAARRSR